MIHITQSYFKSASDIQNISMSNVPNLLFTKTFPSSQSEPKALLEISENCDARKASILSFLGASVGTMMFRFVEARGRLAERTPGLTRLLDRPDVCMLIPANRRMKATILGQGTT